MRTTRVHYVDANGEHWGRVGETGYDQNWLRCVETDRGARHRASVESEYGPPVEVCTRPNSFSDISATTVSANGPITDIEPDHSPGAADVLPGITCSIPGHCDPATAPYASEVRDA